MPVGAQSAHSDPPRTTDRKAWGPAARHDAHRLVKAWKPTAPATRIMKASTNTDGSGGPASSACNPARSSRNSRLSFSPSCATRSTSSTSTAAAAEVA